MIYPFGYKAINNNGVIEVVLDPIKAEAVKVCFEMYISNQFPVDFICREVKERFKLDIYKLRLAEILKNKFYSGILELPDKEITHTFPTIVSREEQEKAIYLLMNRHNHWKTKLPKNRAKRGWNKK